MIRFSVFLRRRNIRDCCGDVRSMRDVATLIIVAVNVLWVFVVVNLPLHVCKSVTITAWGTFDMPLG